jgi:hypothetical protein
VVRQAMSFSFLTGALIYFGDKKYIKFFLFIIPAISFHISSVFILPVLALGFVRFKKRIFPIAVTFFGMIILYNIDILSILFFFLKIFNSKYLRYSAYIAGDTYHLQSGTILTFFAVIVRSLMVFLAVYFYSDISKKDKKTVFILNMSIIYSYLGMLSLHHRIIGRLRQAFEFVPFLVGGYAFQPLKKYKKIIMYVIILLNVGLFENTILRSNRETVGAGVYPYYSVFSKDK